MTRSEAIEAALRRMVEADRRYDAQWASPDCIEIATSHSERLAALEQARATLAMPPDPAPYERKETQA